MTQGAQVESLTDLEMEAGDPEGVRFEEEAESMEDDRDAEVTPGNGALAVLRACRDDALNVTLHYGTSLSLPCISSFGASVWTHDGGDQTISGKRWGCGGDRGSASSRSPGHPGRGPPPAGSGAAGCQKEEEEAAEESQ